MLAQQLITVQLTPEQHQIFISAMDEAKRRDLSIADWTGETFDQIEARYQIPADDILEDMASAYRQQFTGINQF